MQRKSIWISLALAVVLVCVVSLGVTPAASAHPSRPAAHHHASVISGCASGKILITLSDPYPYPGVVSLFNNYTPSCVTYDPCVDISPYTWSWVCLYQDASYGGQEIAFVGYGCANLTDFAGPGPGGTWNDAMSSFRWYEAAGGNPLGGAFWWDTYDSGYYYLFGYPGSGRQTYSAWIGSTWNDQASSVLLDPNPDSSVC